MELIRFLIARSNWTVLTLIVRIRVFLFAVFYSHCILERLHRLLENVIVFVTFVHTLLGLVLIRQTRRTSTNSVIYVTAHCLLYLSV